MLRQARKEESLLCAKLLMQALEQVGNILSGFDEEDKILETLTKFMEREDNKLSYKNIIIKEKNGELVGALCAYPGKDEDALNLAFIEHLKKLGKNFNLDKECFADEFYIDSLSVDTKHRKQGCAKELIEEAGKKAKKLGFTKLALIADKEKNINYYKKLGFKIDCELAIHNALYSHMIKEL